MGLNAVELERRLILKFKQIYHYIIFTFYFQFVHKDLLMTYYYFQCTINVQHI